MSDSIEDLYEHAMQPSALKYLDVEMVSIKHDRGLDAELKRRFAAFSTEMDTGQEVFYVELPDRLGSKRKMAASMHSLDCKYKIRVDKSQLAWKRVPKY